MKDENLGQFPVGFGAHRWRRGLCAGAVATLLLSFASPAIADEPICQTSSPVSGSYSTTVCLVDPPSNANITGDQAISATVTTTGKRSIEQVVFSMSDEYLLTDFVAPYSFTLPSDQWVDGARTLSVHATMSDDFSTQPASAPISLLNGVTTPPVNSNTFTPRGTDGGDEDLVVGVVGDGAFGSQEATDVTDLVASWDPGMFLYLGDVYGRGSIAEFYNWYGVDQDWGQFRSITNPTPGNHEYETQNADPYFYYWDNVPHYYSFDAGGWHFISLDTNSEFDETDPESAQYEWLEADLAANEDSCTIAYFHHPRYSPRNSGGNAQVGPIWSLLVAEGVEVAVTGHDHNYQRWVPLDGNGSPSDSGVTQFVVGTGGEDVTRFANEEPRVAAGFDSAPNAYGAMKLEVSPDELLYSYHNTNGTQLDSGEMPCDQGGGSDPDVEIPTAPTLSAVPDGSSSVQLSWTSSTDNVGVVGYDIYRDGELLESVGTETSFADTTVVPGGSYDYFVRARDAATNVSEPSNTETVDVPELPAPPPIFKEGFESGDLSNWTVVDGMNVQQKYVFGGDFAARAKSRSKGVHATKVLSSGQSDFHYRVRFKVVGKSEDVVYLSRFRAMDDSLVGGLMLNRQNRLGWRNGPALKRTLTSGPVSKGEWHEVKVHVLIDGTSSLTEVWLDGASLPKLTRTESLGTNPVRRLQLGESEPQADRRFDIAFDNVLLSSEPIGDV